MANLFANPHPQALREIKDLSEAVIQGDRIKKEIFLERLGTNDGVFAFAALTQANLRKNYPDYPKLWPAFAQRTVVSDFRPISWIDFNYSLANFKLDDKGQPRHPDALPKVAEGEKYQAFSLTSSTQNFAVEKFGAAFGWTWEAFINDPFNTVRRVPQHMLRHAAYTEDINATRALFAAADSQPHVAAAPAAGGFPATVADAPLSFESLAAAVDQLKSKKDDKGNSIQVGQLVLVTGPTLSKVAGAILSATQITRRIAGAGNSYTDLTGVPTFGNVTHQENRFLPFFAGNDSTWILAPQGGETPGGDATILQAFLAGEEAPEIRVSGLAGYTPNGNALPFTSGSFDTDTFDMRVRVVGGAGAVNALPLILSDGTGA